MRHHKKGVIDDLANLLTALGTLAILGAVIFLIIAESQDQVVTQGACDNTSLSFNETDYLCYDTTLAGASDGASFAYNASTGVQSAASDVPGWLPIIVITIIGGVLLTLVRFFRQQ